MCSGLLDDEVQFSRFDDRDGHLARNVLQLVELMERGVAVVDVICRCRQVGYPVIHDLQSETCVRRLGVRVIFFFGRILHCSKEVEERKGKGDHIRVGLGFVVGAWAAASPTTPGDPGMLEIPRTGLSLWA